MRVKSSVKKICKSCKIVKRKIGQIEEIECLGRKTATWVIFAKRNDCEVLGLHALEGLRLEIDPYRTQLRKRKAIKALYNIC